MGTLVCSRRAGRLVEVPLCRGEGVTLGHGAPWRPSTSSSLGTGHLGSEWRLFPAAFTRRGESASAGGGSVAAGDAGAAPLRARASWSHASTRRAPSRASATAAQGGHFPPREAEQGGNPSSQAGGGEEVAPARPLPRCPASRQRRQVNSSRCVHGENLAGNLC